MRVRWTSVLAAAALAGCAEREPPDPVTTRTSALAQTLTPIADTFINSAYADNNNGASPSIYTGTNGMSGVMRGLVRFAMPPALQGRVMDSRVTLIMVTRGLSSTQTSPPTAATETLQALTQDWIEGAGLGDTMTTNTVGQACGTLGATWNQPNCGGSTPWTGGSVAGTASGTASVPAAVEASVTWDSAAGSAGMVADVQSWLDTPAANHGWRIASSTEGATAQAQRFYSREVAGKGPTLAVTASCRAGFTEVAGGCSACTATANAACATAQAGNLCNDVAGPSPSYVCVCNNPAYSAMGTGMCADKNECATNHCRDAGDQTASCTDAVAPATGYTCSCGAGFSFNGVTCVGARGGWSAMTRRRAMSSRTRCCRRFDRSRGSKGTAGFPPGCTGSR